MGLYAGYPITPRLVAPEAAPRRRSATRGWKNLKGLLVRVPVVDAPGPSRCASRAWQVVLFVGLHPRRLPAGVPGVLAAAVDDGVAGAQPAARRRRARGHAALPDRRLTTHHVRQSGSARFWMVPFNTGWHLAHHVDIGVPFPNLPRLHRELEPSRLDPTRARVAELSGAVASGGITSRGARRHVGRRLRRHCRPPGWVTSHV